MSSLARLATEPSPIAIGAIVDFSRDFTPWLTGGETLVSTPAAPLVEIVAGTAGGITISNVSIDGTKVLYRLVGVLAGTYWIRILVYLSDGERAHHWHKQVVKA